MNPSDMLSRIGGAAQGGSAKPPQEREKQDRMHGEEPQPSPVGSDQQRQSQPPQSEGERERKE
jgi:hypothetical protein